MLSIGDMVCSFGVVLLIGDVVDCILESLIDTNRTRRQIIRQLIIMDLITNSKQLKRGMSTGQVTWSEAEEEQLRELYDKHKDDNGIDPTSS